jgi:hypothetical protein
VDEGEGGDYDVALEEFGQCIENECADGSECEYFADSEGGGTYNSTAW